MPPEPLRAAGPLGKVFQTAGGRLNGPSGDGANALIMLNRLAFFDAGTGKLDDGGRRALLRWAREEKLGQASGLVREVGRRRLAALYARPGCWLRLRAKPEWRLVVGLGSKANAHEIGLALHGTYGWPVIPGSALKGLAAAWAVESGVQQVDLLRVLGGPRLGMRDVPAAMGSVSFLDALPDRVSVNVAADVMTPHVKPYYDAIAKGAPRPAPPAEYHNPVPVTFLTVSGAYTIDLCGQSEADLDLAAEWLAKAGDELGAGAKTAAGYGYLAIDRVAGAP
jgi:CRISPR/Cas system CMR subunit Cmr6 (Cas7 group RAMP superfamily)